MKYPESIANLIESFSRLPGIGPKSASRLAFFVLKMKDLHVERFAKDLLDVKQTTFFCSQCGHITDIDPCMICRDESRDRSQVCVVENITDVFAIEKMGEYKGLYHVLHGSLSPMDGIGVADLKIPELLKRLEDPNIKEVILATNPNIEGESTALYIYSKLKDTDLKVTKMAHGLPVGGDLEYADEVTLSRAFEGRREF